MFKSITDHIEACGVYPMKRPIWGALLFCLTLAVAGCTKSGQNGAPSDKATGDARSPPQERRRSTQPERCSSPRNVPKRSSLEGRWAMLFYQRLSGMEVPGAWLTSPSRARTRGLWSR